MPGPTRPARRPAGPDGPDGPDGPVETMFIDWQGSTDSEAGLIADDVGRC